LLTKLSGRANGTRKPARQQASFVARYFMTYIFKALLFSYLLCPHHSFGQDTLCYCNASYYVSDCLYFQKIDPTTNKGRFEKIMDFDDGQHLYGSGTFLKLKGKLILDSFKLVRTLYRFVDGKKIIDNSVKDTSTIISMIFYEKNGYLLPYDNKRKQLDYTHKFLLTKLDKKN